MQTDLLQATKQVLPLFELLNADNNFVSCSFSHLLKKERGKSFCVNIASLKNHDVPYTKQRLALITFV